MTPFPGPRWAVRAIVALVAVVLVGAVAVLVWRDRGRPASVALTPATPLPGGSAVPTTAAPSGTRSAKASGKPSATAPTAARCAAERAGPLRQDTQFTAADGSGVVVRYSVSLPPDYYTACRTYPVLYVLHGKGESNASFLDAAASMRKAMAAGVLDQAVIVTPDSFNTGRWENRDTGPAEDNFINRLIPHVEKAYRVKDGASERLLAGFSMGGHGALRFGLKYPQLFAAVWSVDGAMASPQDYLPFVQGRRSADFRIMAVGGQLNGDRVQRLVDALKDRGIDLPYAYQDREHQFGAFVDEDEKAGWAAMKFLEQNLGRQM